MTAGTNHSHWADVWVYSLVHMHAHTCTHTHTHTQKDLLYKTLKIVRH